MVQICEIVTSNIDNLKLVVNGFIMTKDKNRDDLYYWCCGNEKRCVVVVMLVPFKLMDNIVYEVQKSIIIAPMLLENM